MLNHPLRRRSESSSTVMNSDSHQGEGLHGHQYGNSPRIETMGLEHTHHYPVLDTSSVHNPVSPQTSHAQLLFQPTHHTNQGLHLSDPQAQSYTFSSTPSSAFTSGASTPTASTVSSSPRLAMDPFNSFNSFLPGISSPTVQPQFPPTSPHMERLSVENKPPLIWTRLDPTLDLYKLYPMSTIAIIPWLDGSMTDQEVLNQHLANLNVSASSVQCLSPKVGTEQLSFPSPSNTYGIPYAPEGNPNLDDMARRPSGSWGVGYDT